MQGIELSFMDLARVVAGGTAGEVSRLLTGSPSLAMVRAEEGATRSEASTFFLTEIVHYVYDGDTCLHVAAAAFRRPIAELLVAHGANCRAKNRRNAEPLHYAADTNRWSPEAQAATITYLISIGADPNARDAAGVTPLHRAVRTRSLPAVRALVEGGADPALANRNGSTALDIARRTTGRGGSGTEHTKRQQSGIIRFLSER